jgi:hypothetical protein
MYLKVKIQIESSKNRPHFTRLFHALTLYLLYFPTHYLLSDFLLPKQYLGSLKAAMFSVGSSLAIRQSAFSYQLSINLMHLGACIKHNLKGVCT